MSTFLNVNEIKEKVSLLNLLKNLGFTPQKISGGEHFFLSMLREEYTASLCVNDNLGVWFDHGGAGVSGIRSGSVIDFGLAYWYPSSFPEVLRKIVDHAGMQMEDMQGYPTLRIDRSVPLKVPNYAVESINNSIQNNKIKTYLEERQVAGISEGYLYELYYSVTDNQNRRRNFFASGWPNENGGWEVRNKYFKGCLGHKGMTFLQGAVDRLCIFEGYFDFLTWKLEHPKDPASILVLNSLSFLKAAKARVKNFNAIEIYFDHDKAGISATQELISEVSRSVDCSSKYGGFKDYNEKLIADQRPIKKQMDRTLNFSAEHGFAR